MGKKERVITYRIDTIIIIFSFEIPYNGSKWLLTSLKMKACNSIIIVSVCCKIYLSKTLSTKIKTIKLTMINK